MQSKKAGIGRPISPDPYKKAQTIGDLLMQHSLETRYFVYKAAPRRQFASNNQCYLLRELLNNSILEVQEYISLCSSLERRLGYILEGNFRESWDLLDTTPR